MWRDEAWLLDMLQACRKALQHAEGLNEHRFHVSPLHQDAIIRWCRQRTRAGEAGIFPRPHSLLECLKGVTCRLRADSLKRGSAFPVGAG